MKTGRRELVATAVAVGRPVFAAAQRIAKIPRIGFLDSTKMIE